MYVDVDVEEEEEVKVKSGWLAGFHFALVKKKKQYDFFSCHVIYLNSEDM